MRSLQTSAHQMISFTISRSASGFGVGSQSCGFKISPQFFITVGSRIFLSKFVHLHRKSYFQLRGTNFDVIEPNISDPSAFDRLPAGLARSLAYIKVMRAAEMDYRGPVPLNTLGIDGYAQFTSPIRRYVDLLAHFQIKAFLRGHILPFSAGELENRTFSACLHMKIAKRLQSTSLRYWMLEYLGWRPEDKTYRAIVLCFMKNRTATVLLLEAALEATCEVSEGSEGGQIKVDVRAVHPRKDILLIYEV